MIEISLKTIARCYGKTRCTSSLYYDERRLLAASLLSDAIALRVFRALIPLNEMLEWGSLIED